MLDYCAAVMWHIAKSFNKYSLLSTCSPTYKNGKRQKLNLQRRCKIRIQNEERKKHIKKNTQIASERERLQQKGMFRSASNILWHISSRSQCERCRCPAVIRREPYTHTYTYVHVRICTRTDTTRNQAP